ncbi:MFS general substrate transporter [Microthyrium microscopicum]|uniref:MFS general substrate transporter n=1 Tax=Microthyrium microscopicum TaxID=703497 RepID=A0A6A6UF38_9PEZI|nr:MFS general substrate transporter [Microthyrium microscopicum]
MISAARPTGIAQETTFNSRNGDSSTQAIKLIHNTTTNDEHVRRELIAHGFLINGEGIVTWSGGHPRHPRNWNVKRKIYDTGTMIMFELFGTTISNTGSLTALDAYKRFNISKDLALFAFASTYLIGQAIGAILFPQYTESYGRKPTYLASAVVFTLANVVVGASDNLAGIIIGRFVSGLMSAIPGSVLSGSIEDLWGIQARIWVVDIWVLASVLGIGIAPSFAIGIGASRLGWQWVYHFAAIGAAVITIAIFFIKESRPSRVLKAAIQSLVTLPPSSSIKVEDDDSMPSFSAFVHTGLFKPLHIFCTEPFLVIVTLMSATAYSCAYLLPEALPSVYAGFGYAPTQSGLVYLYMCVGGVLAILVRVWDIRISHRRLQQGKELTPEDKLLGFYIAAPLLTAAFWWFAWTIPPYAASFSPVVSSLAIIPMGFAINEFDYVLTGYIVDTYTSVAGSACAPLGFLRAILSAVFPIVGEKMFERMDNNVAASILAINATAYLGIAVAFYFFANSFRKASPWVRREAEK